MVTLLLRLARLVGGCVVLGIGVAAVLAAQLGSDGYSTLIDALSVTLAIPYAFVNWTVGPVLVLVAWARGVRPGVATVVHPLVVGATVDVGLEVWPTPHALWVRIGQLTAGVLVVALGVAVYLAAQLGSGPVEGLARAAEPVSFRLAYNAIQAVGALAGWLLGAPVGAGTLAVVLGVGPLVARLSTLGAGSRRSRPS